MTIYIAGPMTGIEEFNYPAFNAAAAELRAEGEEVLCPTEHTGGEAPDDYTAEKPYGYYLRRSLRMLLDCDEIYLLPGWESSRGAQLELLIARHLEMGVRTAEPDEAEEDEQRECAKCREPVGFLSSRDWCDGCEEEAAAG